MVIKALLDRSPESERRSSTVRLQPSYTLKIFWLLFKVMQQDSANCCLFVRFWSDLLGKKQLFIDVRSEEALLDSFNLLGCLMTQTCFSRYMNFRCFYIHQYAANGDADSFSFFIERFTFMASTTWTFLCGILPSSWLQALAVKLSVINSWQKMAFQL